MKQSKLSIVFVLLLTILIVPSVALAAWWNPFSWGFWNSIFHKQTLTTKTAPANSINNNSQQEDKALADGYKSDLENTFTKEKFPSFYLTPTQWVYTTNNLPSTKVMGGSISFDSSWGKLQFFKDLNGGTTFNFGNYKTVQFFKNDASAYVKALNKVLVADKSVWASPAGYSDELKSFLAQNKINTIKNLVDYSLAINAQNIIANTDNTQVVIDYSLLQLVKRSIVQPEISAIYKFDNGSLSGYFDMPIKNSVAIHFMLFTHGGNVYSGIFNIGKFTNDDIQTFISSLIISD